jgi:hypothetical protein
MSIIDLWEKDNIDIVDFIEDTLNLEIEKIENKIQEQQEIVGE